MTGGQGRGVIRAIFKNFINSIRPRQISGDKIGDDHLGNRYFEIKRGAGRRDSRWYEPTEHDDFMTPIPSEWQSWLRHRRPQPPTDEEIAKNLAIMKIKKENGERIERERIAAGGEVPALANKGAESYPKYTEYEIGGVPIKKQES